MTKVHNYINSYGCYELIQQGNPEHGWVENSSLSGSINKSVYDLDFSHVIPKCSSLMAQESRNIFYLHTPYIGYQIPSEAKAGHWTAH